MGKAGVLRVDVLPLKTFIIVGAVALVLAIIHLIVGATGSLFNHLIPMS